MDGNEQEEMDYTSSELYEELNSMDDEALRGLAESLWHDEFLNKYFPAHLIEESLILNKDVYHSYISCHGFATLRKIYPNLPDNEKLKWAMLNIITLETESILRKSFFLAATGSYNLATSALRNALECQTNGVFYTLIYKRFLKRLDLFPRIERFYNYGKRKERHFSDIVHDHREKFESSITFFHIIEAFEGKKITEWPISVDFRRSSGGAKLSEKLMFCIRESIMSPFSDSYKDFCKKINYNKLNEYVHESSFSSDIMREIEHSLENPEDDFKTQRVRKNSLEDYLKTLNTLIDCLLVMSINIIDDFGPEAKNLILAELPRFDAHLVPNTCSLLNGMD